MEVADRRRGHLLVLEAGAVAEQAEADLDPLRAHLVVCLLEGALPEVGVMGMDVDLELVLHREDGARRPVDLRLLGPQ
eukprot:3230895-Alexandrium_andersonii.AAC.1